MTGPGPVARVIKDEKEALIFRRKS